MEGCGVTEDALSDRTNRRRSFAFAGLWGTWDENGEEVQAVTIIITESNDVMRPINDRMPVLL